MFSLSSTPIVNVSVAPVLDVYGKLKVMLVNSSALPCVIFANKSLFPTAKLSKAFTASPDFFTKDACADLTPVKVSSRHFTKACPRPSNCFFSKTPGSNSGVFLLKKEYKVHVIELSSFQLETVKSVDSRISVITNLSGDHLDRYKGISDYVSQKKNIITKNGINLLSIDDIYSRKIFNQKKIKNKISFSLVDKSADCFANNDYILDNYFKKNKKLFIKKISKDLEGHFNIQNILIAYICSKILKIPESNFLKVIKTFKGLPFRSSTIFTNNKLKIVNNSKSTNLNSTINSVVNHNNIYLILGGIAKEKNFEILLKYKNKISCVYTYGKSGNFIEKKLKKELVVKKLANLNSVIKETFKDIKKNSNQSTILFAPACASYDQYKNFEERGIHFNKLIKNYIN